MSTSTNSARAEKARDPWDSIGPLILFGGIGIVGAFILLATVAGASISPVIWYIARSAGMTTYLLLWISVITGLGLSTRLLGFVGDQGIMLQLHRMSTDLAIAGVAIHVLSVAVDPTVEIGMLGALVPMTASVRQPWLDIGIISAYGMVGISLSFAVRRWIGNDTWRMLHYLTFGFWALALVHAIGAGTDSGTVWAGIIYIITATSVVFLTTYRILSARGHSRSRAANRLGPAKSSV